MKLRRLRRLKLSRVDLVPRGSNPHSHIELFKREKESSDNESSVAVVRNAKGDAVADKTQDELKAELEKVQTEKATADAELAKARKELAETPAAEVEKAKAEVAKLKAELEKSKDADVRKELDSAKAELVKITKERRTERFEKEAQSFTDLGPAKTIGKLLESADEHFDENSQKAFKQLLASAAKQVEEGALFKRLSEDGGEPQDWQTKLNEAARDRVAKGTSPTVEQAKVKIMEEDPELRKEYQASVRS